MTYHDIVPAPQDVEKRRCAHRASLHEVLQSSEYVTLHVPLDPSTRAMINRETLALMRQDSILINTCRGPVVDEAAVAKALDSGRIWGYGADVFTVEPPLPGHPLIGRSDVMLTPHSAAQTEEGLRTMATTIAQEVVGVLRGELPTYPVNDPAEVEHVRRSWNWHPFTAEVVVRERRCAGPIQRLVDRTRVIGVVKVPPESPSCPAATSRGRS